MLRQPEALAVDSAGNLVIVNELTSQLLQRKPNGALTVLAGDGRHGFSGDRGPARNARLNHPGGLTVSPKGDLYVADTGNNRVRVIRSNGIIDTVAGNGRAHPTYVRKLATHAAIPAPLALAFGNGSLYIADEAGIQRIDSQGFLQTLVRGGPNAISTPKGRVALWPDAVGLDRAGHIFVADSSPKLLLEFSSDGRHLLRSWPLYVSQAGLSGSLSGGVDVADYGNFAIDRIAGGRLSVLQRFSRNSLSKIRGVFRPSGVTESARGSVYADTDGVNGGTFDLVVIQLRGDKPPRVLAL